MEKIFDIIPRLRFDGGDRHYQNDYKNKYRVDSDQTPRQLKSDNDQK